MKSPFVINSRGKLILRSLHEGINAILEAARARAAKRAKLVELAKLAMDHGKEGVDYYV